VVLLFICCLLNYHFFHFPHILNLMCQMRIYIIIVGSCKHSIDCHRFANIGGLQVWTGAVKIVNKQSRTAHKVWSSSLEVGVAFTIPHRKNELLMKHYTRLTVSIDTRLRAGRPGFNSLHGQWWEFWGGGTDSRLAPGSTQPTVQWAPGALSSGVKREGRDADHLPSSSTEVKSG
jgi:hypothetical protein